MKHRCALHRAVVPLAAALCLGLAACSTNPDPATSPSTPVSASPSGPYGHPYLADDAMFLQSEKVLLSYIDLSVKYLGSGGVDPLPEEFSKYLMDGALLGEASLESNSVQVHGSYSVPFTYSVDDMNLYHGGDVPEDAGYSLSGCFTYDGTKVDSAGALIWQGPSHTSGVYHFKTDTTDGGWKIFEYNELAVDKCVL
jgi:hypothetical protein